MNNSPIDGATVTWSTDVYAALPNGATYVVTFAADPDMEEQIVDLLYSKLDNDYYRPAREQLLGVMGTAKSDSTLFKDAQERLRELNKVSVPYTIYANIVDGHDVENREVYLVIAFFLRGEVNNGGTGHT